MNIQRVHEINLIILKEIDRICKKYNIKYRLEAGTLLGAIRHKGFIPWDDDADVAFLRPEYEKFKDAIKKEKLVDGIVFKKASENLDYFHDFTDRLFYTKEVYREGQEYQERFGGIYQYLFVDLFILDNLDEKETKNIMLKHKIIYGLAMSYRHKIDLSKYNGIFMKLAVFILSMLGKFIRLDSIYKDEEKLATKCKDNNTKYVYYSNYPIIWMGYKTERTLENDYVYADFEDTKFPIMKDYKEALYYFYGNYNELPPIEKRIPEHEGNIW